MAILSAVCLVSGAALAYVAPRDPMRQATYEGLGGTLIVAGLVLIGAGLTVLA